LEVDLDHSNKKRVGFAKDINRENLVLLRDVCNNNKIQLIDAFKNFDIHNRKKIEQKQFVKVLVDAFGNFKVLNNSEIEEITEF